MESDDDLDRDIYADDELADDSDGTNALLTPTSASVIVATGSSSSTSASTTIGTAGQPSSDQQGPFYGVGENAYVWSNKRLFYAQVQTVKPRKDSSGKVKYSYDVQYFDNPFKKTELVREDAVIDDNEESRVIHAGQTPLPGTTINTSTSIAVGVADSTKKRKGRPPGSGNKAKQSAIAPTTTTPTTTTTTTAPTTSTPTATTTSTHVLTLSSRRAATAAASKVSKSGTTAEVASVALDYGRTSRPSPSPPPVDGEEKRGFGMGRKPIPLTQVELDAIARAKLEVTEGRSYPFKSKAYIAARRAGSTSIIHPQHGPAAAIPSSAVSSSSSSISAAPLPAPTTFVLAPTVSPPIAVVSLPSLQSTAASSSSSSSSVPITTHPRLTDSAAASASSSLFSVSLTPISAAAAVTAAATAMDASTSTAPPADTPHVVHVTVTGPRLKTLKQILTAEHYSALPPSVPTYSNIDVGPSSYPAKKYCDITGVKARYTDPRTKIRYSQASHYALIQSLSNDIVQGYLDIRQANVHIR